MSQDSLINEQYMWVLHANGFAQWSHVDDEIHLLISDDKNVWNDGGELMQDVLPAEHCWRLPVTLIFQWPRLYAHNIPVIYWGIEVFQLCCDSCKHIIPVSITWLSPFSVLSVFFLSAAFYLAELSQQRPGAAAAASVCRKPMCCFQEPPWVMGLRQSSRRTSSA